MDLRTSLKLDAPVCARFRGYEVDDRYCVGLRARRARGRMRVLCRALRLNLRAEDDDTTLHCPRCGKVLRGRQKEYDA